MTTPDTADPLVPINLRDGATIEQVRTAGLHYFHAAVEADAQVELALAGPLGFHLEQPGDPGFSLDHPTWATGDHTGVTLAQLAGHRLTDVAAFARAADHDEHCTADVLGPDACNCWKDHLLRRLGLVS